MRGCQQTTSRSGHGEDFIREGLVSDVVCLLVGWLVGLLSFLFG